MINHNRSPSSASTLHGHSTDTNPTNSTTHISRDQCSRIPDAEKHHYNARPTNPSPLEEAPKPRMYIGSGTRENPFVVGWDVGDPENPYNWSKTRRWVITMQLALGTFTVSFGSSSYAGGLHAVMQDLNISADVAILGISLYVLGFALGPLVFAPMGEMFGRRIVFLVTLSAYTLFQLAGSLGKNLPTLLACRLLTGIFGSSPLTNAGGAVTDIWNARERGLSSAIYATVPFLGPVIGPIVGGFVVQNPHLGWRFTFWLMFIFSFLTLVTGYIFTPETYAPVLLRKRAERLSKDSNGAVFYATQHDRRSSRTFAEVMRVNLSRPFVFIVTEPIVLLLAIYVSVVYGTLYALFSGFPIVFQQHRGFTPGQGGLAFLGVGLGIIIGTTSQSYQNVIYGRVFEKNGKAPPEARLHLAILGGLLVPIGLFWFAWTTDPRIHWIVPILAGIPFGAGVAQILQALTAYMMDTYKLYFASAFAATVVLRSICGAVFPLFSPSMFHTLGDSWAMTVFAVLSLLCVPIPVLFWKYGPLIRSKSTYALKDDAEEEDEDTQTHDSRTRTTLDTTSASARASITQINSNCATYSKQVGPGGEARVQRMEDASGSIINARYEFEGTKMGTNGPGQANIAAI